MKDNYDYMELGEKLGLTAEESATAAEVVQALAEGVEPVLASTKANKLKANPAKVAEFINTALAEVAPDRGKVWAVLC